MSEFRAIIRAEACGHGSHAFTRPTIIEALALYFDSGATFYADEDGQEPLTREDAAASLSDPHQGREVTFYNEDGDRFTITAERI